MSPKRFTGFIETETLLRIFLFTIFILIATNLLFLDFKVLITPRSTGTLQENKEQLLSPLPSASVSSSDCLEPCQQTIDKKVSKLKEELTTYIQTKLQKSSVATSLPAQITVPTTSSQPKEVYIFLGSGGSTKLTDWTDVSGSDIKFNKDNYPGAKAIYFQANLSADAQDRAAYARLLDVGAGTGVGSSDINYTGTASTLVESGAISLNSGNITLRVQLHSLNGNLATVTNPKIRIQY